MAPNHRKLTPKEADQLFPIIKQFNALAKGFVQVLNFKLERRERRIRLLLNELTVPERSNRISVHPVDMRQLRKQGKKWGKHTGSESFETTRLKEQFIKDLKRPLII